MTEQRQLIKRTGIVSFFTFLSRVTGLTRDIVIAYAFGTRMAADAFFVAFRLPNLLRRLFAEGALAISFVPVFTASLKKSEDEARDVVNATFSLTAVILFGVSILGVLAAPWLVKMIAYGFTEDLEKFDTTVLLARVMFPYIFFISLSAVAMGILNSVKHFAVPAASPIILNIGIIIGALWLTQVMNPPILGLALGVIGGGIFQLGVHFPILKKHGFFPRIKWDPQHPSVKRMLHLMIPSAYGAAVYQFNVIIITFLASFLVEGAVSYLWYADRLVEFPLGIFGIAVATVILPTLSEQAAEGKDELMKETLIGGLRFVFFITVPAMVGLIVLATPMIQVLFEHGSFTAASTVETAYALYAFAIGLPFIAGVRVVTNAFFALHDAKTPVKAANISVLVNIGLSLILMRFLAHSGLALSISLAAIVNFFIQCVFLHQKIGPLKWGQCFQSLVKIIVAALVMGLVVSYATHWGRFLFAKSVLSSIFILSFWILVGLGSYMTVAYVLGSPELKETLGLFRRKFR